MCNCYMLGLVVCFGGCDHPFMTHGYVSKSKCAHRMPELGANGRLKYGAGHGTYQFRPLLAPIAWQPPSNEALLLLVIYIQGHFATSWVFRGCLGRPWTLQNLEKQLVFQGFCECSFSVLRSSWWPLGPILAPLVPIWSQKGSQHGSPNGSKSTPK